MVNQCDEFLFECDECHELFDMEQMSITEGCRNICLDCVKKIDLTNSPIGV